VFSNEKYTALCSTLCTPNGAVSRNKKGEKEGRKVKGPISSGRAERDPFKENDMKASERFH
jgi:hypothetical protein